MHVQVNHAASLTESPSLGSADPEAKSTRRLHEPGAGPMPQGNAQAQDVAAVLRDCVINGGLRTLFQPVLDLRQGQIHGYEALTRGPAGTSIEAPLALFAAARKHGLAAELEFSAVRMAVSRFCTGRREGNLFVNFSPGVLADGHLEIESMLDLVEQLGLPPRRLVIELSETEAMSDNSRAWDELARFRARGFRIAIDDLGEGFSSLRLWTELRPEYVKVDKHFVHGVHSDPLKLQMVRAFQQIAQVSGSSVIAEGIEDAADFMTVRDLGIWHGQGYLIGRPSQDADDQAPVELWRRLSGGPVRAFPQGQEGPHGTTARQLMRNVDPFHPGATTESVLRRFEEEPDLQAAAVVDQGRPVGVINRYTVIDRFSRRFQRELYGKRSCVLLMNAQPVVVDLDIRVQDLSRLVTASGTHRAMDGFVITQAGRYAGIGSVIDLMREITDQQIAAARYANPLTMLPGNVPISEHVQRLITQGCSFAVAYADLDNFKPFNDVFGYQRGDEILQLLARVLAEQADPILDFVGHIGGDDFVLVLQSPDWEARCARSLESLADRLLTLFSAEDLASNGYVAEDRKGNAQVFPLPSLSIGALRIEQGTFTSHSEVAAAATQAKRMAKQVSGNSLFVERRNYPVSSWSPGTTND